MISHGKSINGFLCDVNLYGQVFPNRNISASFNIDTEREVVYRQNTAFTGRIQELLAFSRYLMSLRTPFKMRLAS